MRRIYWGRYHSAGCYDAENATGRHPPSSITKVMTARVFRILPLLLLAGAIGAAIDDYSSVKRKFSEIEGERLRPGTRVVMTRRELDAYVAREAPPGVRNPQVELQAGVAKGTALIDFGKVRRAQGYRPGWLMSKLLDGERPVSVTARIRSGNGQATVDVQSVEISGIQIDGRTLDFLIQNFLLAMYPTAAVGRPFELGHRIERLDVAARIRERRHRQVAAISPTRPHSAAKRPFANCGYPPRIRRQDEQIRAFFRRNCSAIAVPGQHRAVPRRRYDGVERRQSGFHQQLDLALQIAPVRSGGNGHAGLKQPPSVPLGHFQSARRRRPTPARTRPGDRANAPETPRRDLPCR